MYLLWALLLLSSFTLMLGHRHYHQHENGQTFRNDPSPYKFIQRPFTRQLTYPIYKDQLPSRSIDNRVTSNNRQTPQPLDNLELATDSSQENEQESVTTSATVEPRTTDGSKHSHNNKDSDQDNNQNLKAVAVLRGKAKGNLYFEQIGDQVHITGTISGLTNGLHAFHVHHYGDLTRSCESSGDHFNPHKTKHGSPFDSVRHVGDLGNVFADESEVATIDIKDKVLSLREGKNNILGHTIIVHENVDDLGRGGHVKAGRRIGCGIIGWRNDLA